MEMPDNLGCFSRFLFKLDNRVMKPFLIYEYSLEKELRDDTFFE